MPNEFFNRLLPESVLLGGAVSCLVVGLWLPRRRQWLVAVIAAAALLTALVPTAFDLAGDPVALFDGTYSLDTALGVGRLVIIVGTLLTLVLSVEPVHEHARETEFYVLLLLGALGAMVLAGTNDLIVLAPAYLLASVPLYALAGFAKDSRGTEAALKYFLLGALLGVVMLLGITVLYGAGGATDYPTLAQRLPGAARAAVAVGLVGVLAGLLFKVGAVPGHFWVPDVTDGAPAPVAAFVTTLPKVGGLIATYRFVGVALRDTAVDWPLLIAVIAAVTMTLGNLAAFTQDTVRRLLAYSTISQVGYLLMAVAVAGRSDLALPSLLFYLGAYTVTNLGAFAVVVELPRAALLRDYAGLFRRRPLLAVSLVVCLLGLIGTPPTSVFVGKLAIFTAAIDGGFAWLAVLAAVNSVASVFYYLRWVAPMFLRQAGDAPAPVLASAGRWAAGGAYAAALASVALGLASALVLTPVADAVLR